MSTLQEKITRSRRLNEHYPNATNAEIRRAITDHMTDEALEAAAVSAEEWCNHTTENELCKYNWFTASGFP